MNDKVDWQPTVVKFHCCNQTHFEIVKEESISDDVTLQCVNCSAMYSNEYLENRYDVFRNNVAQFGYKGVE